ncbi:MAG: FliG C-terminal domain-containing protein [Pseudomonadota bacterium]
MTEMTPAAPPAPRGLSGPERAAIVLSLLEPDVARNMAERFDEGRTDRAIEAFENLPMVQKEDLLEVISSYIDALDGNVPLVAGGRLRADELAQALSPMQMMTFEDDMLALTDEGSLDDGADPEQIWTYVRALEPEKLGALLLDERPAMISAVIQRLEEEGASAVIRALPTEKAIDVTRMIVTGKRPSARTYDAIAESLRRTAPDKLAVHEAGDGLGAEKIASIFNRLPASQQKAILDPIRSEMPEELSDVDEHLLSFPNLHDQLPKTAVPALFREVDKALLDKALGHALTNQPEVAEFLLGSISQRLAEQIRERIDEQPPVGEVEGEEAQAELMGILIQWADEDRFSFKLAGVGA